MYLKSYLFVFCILTFSACIQSSSEQKQPKHTSMLDIQGHRGCRGLMPENSIPAFLKAIDIGVTTLELDVVISKDSQVVVSHEPFFSHEICSSVQGQEVTEENEREFNLYQMNYEEIKAVDCGSKFLSRFPEQQKMVVNKPLLKEVIDAAEAYAKEKGAPPLLYNIETKSSPKGDHIYHPEPGVFVDLLVHVMQEKGILDRTTLQSFDLRTLQIAHRKYPNIVLVLLIANEDSPQQNLDKLGFTPEVYSPFFKAVDEDLVAFCREKNMKLIPWTVNEEKDIQTMIAFGVSGIISDYPDRVIERVNK